MQLLLLNAGGPLQLYLFTKYLTHFVPLISFDTPWKHQKTRSFLMFSGGIKRDQWHEIGWKKNVFGVLCIIYHFVRRSLKYFAKKLIFRIFLNVNLNYAFIFYRLSEIFVTFRVLIFWGLWTALARYTQRFFIIIKKMMYFWMKLFLRFL